MLNLYVALASRSRSNSLPIIPPTILHDNLPHGATILKRISNKISARAENVICILHYIEVVWEISIENRIAMDEVGVRMDLTADCARETGKNSQNEPRSLIESDCQRC